MHNDEKPGLFRMDRVGSRRESITPRRISSLKQINIFHLCGCDK